MINTTSTLIENLTDINFLWYWFFSSGLRITFILAGAYLITRLGRNLIGRGIRHLIETGFVVGGVKPVLEEQRIQTLQNGFASVFRIMVWALAVVTIMPEFGVNISPILTGIGIGGLVLGIGSRNVVQDYWAGFFVLMEDQFRVGEKVKIADIEGIVHDFTLRRTILKDENGFFSYIPNGQINKVTNYSRQPS